VIIMGILLAKLWNLFGNEGDSLYCLLVMKAFLTLLVSKQNTKLFWLG